MYRLPYADKDDPAEDFLRWSVRTQWSSSSTCSRNFTKDFMVPFTTCIMVVLVLVLWLRWYMFIWPNMLQNEALKNVIVIENMEVRSMLAQCDPMSLHQDTRCVAGEANLLIRSESVVAATFYEISGYLTLIESLTPITGDTIVGLMRMKYKPTSAPSSTARFKVPFELEMFDDNVYMQILRNGSSPTAYLDDVYLTFHVLGETFFKKGVKLYVMNYTLLDPNVSGAIKALT